MRVGCLARNALNLVQRFIIAAARLLLVVLDVDVQIRMGNGELSGIERSLRLDDAVRHKGIEVGGLRRSIDLCIAFQGMRCEVCYRTCPLIDEAIVIDYRLREGDAIHSVFAPVIDEDKCVGCGLCVERCVVSEPRVAIRIASDEERAGGIEPSA